MYRGQANNPIALEPLPPLPGIAGLRKAETV